MDMTELKKLARSNAKARGHHMEAFAPCGRTGAQSAQCRKCRRLVIIDPFHQTITGKATGQDCIKPPTI